MRRLIANVVLASFFSLASSTAFSQADDPFGGDPFGESPASAGPTEVADSPFDDGGEAADPFDDGPADAFAPNRSCLVDEAPPTPRPPAHLTRIWASPGEQANEPIREKLAGPLTSAGLDFVDTPLDEVVEFLADEYAIEVHLDVPALDSLGLRPDETVSCDIRGVTLRAALRLMLNQLELVAVPHDGYLLITTEEEVETQLIVAVYPVGDLGPAVLQQPQRSRVRREGGTSEQGFAGAAKVHCSEAPLVEMLTRCIASGTWANCGGGEAEAYLLPNGTLIVSQTRQVHDQIVALLEALRRVPANLLIDPADLPKPDPPQGGGGAGASRGGGGVF